MQKLESDEDNYVTAGLSSTYAEQHQYNYFHGQSFGGRQPSSSSYTFNQVKSPKNLGSRDFKAEYLKLAEQLINLGMEKDVTPNGAGIMLVSENDIQGYQDRIRREI